MGKHEVLRDKRVWAWDDMSTGPLCELIHTLLIFRLDLAERAGRSPDAGTTCPDKYALALPQANQARTDLDSIESDL
jgi:hypothetical protein